MLSTAKRDTRVAEDHTEESVRVGVEALDPVVLRIRCEVT